MFVMAVKREDKSRKNEQKHNHSRKDILRPHQKKEGSRKKLASKHAFIKHVTRGLQEFILS